MEVLTAIKRIPPSCQVHVSCNKVTIIGLESRYAIPGHYTEFGSASVLVRVVVMVARATFVLWNS